MSLWDLFGAQMMDVFRWGLLVALVLTTANTSAVTGTLIPLAAGVLFVAVLIPFTMTPDLAPQTAQVLVGLASNLIILAAVLGIRSLWRRFRAP